MSSAISTPTYQAKASNVFNADSTPIYNSATGDWTLKNASGVTTFSCSGVGVVVIKSNGTAGGLRFSGNGTSTQRIQTLGNDASTNGIMEFYSYRSDLSNEILAGSYTGAGAWTFPISASTNSLILPQITALTASNQNVAGKYRMQYGSTATPLTLNGLAGGVLGQTVIIDNSAAGTVTINSLNAGGTQQFLCPANATLTMPTFTMATFLYDGTYWRCISTTKGVS
jgi:hypothetical protein